ncbi:MAG TPA: ABC transporter permease [Candidatus Angelobacter sp.]|nr:ABC transporter permease [Candidatus Angelobacter sp.]
MSLSTIIREALQALVRNRIRSLLTMLGIVMGVGSFICVVAVGHAGSSRVEDQLSKVGDNLIWVEAGSRAVNGVRIGSRGTRTLVVGDVQAVLDQVPGVKSATPNVDGHIQVVYGNLNWGTQYRGVSPEFFEIRKWEFRLGGNFTQDDVERNAPVCVLGQTVATSLFGDDDPLGKTINIQAVPFKVIGVLQARGFSATGADQDDFVVMPITTAQKRITGQEWLDDIFFSAVSREEIPEVTKQIIGIMRERHHLRAGDLDDFNIRTPEELIRAQLAAANVFTLLLASAASLSLLVGGIGIMNIMLVSVTERTREIGIRLAVGATEQDIQMQFLSEAMVMSLIGGALGVLAGVLGSFLLQNTLHWEMQLSAQIMVIAGLFSAGVGIFFGYYPAHKASQLDPIEGLRYE